MNFVSDPSEFDALRTASSNVFMNSTPGLPSQVFDRRHPRNFSFVDFDHLLTRRFWATLKALAGQADDAALALLVREPDPVAYYFKNFHRFAAIRFDRTDGGEDYHAAVHQAPAESPADSLFDVANVVTVFGSSPAWGIWGDRSLGIAVLGLSPSLAIPDVEGIRWQNAEQALHGPVSLMFKNQSVPAELARMLREKYPF